MTHGSIVGIRIRSNGEHCITLHMLEMMRCDHDASSRIRGHNNIDSTPSITSELLIEDDEAN